MESGARIIDALEYKKCGLQAKLYKLEAQRATGINKSRLLIKSRLASLQQKEIADRLCLGFLPEKEASDASERDNNGGRRAPHAVCILLF